MPTTQIDPGSFRDREGRVFFHEGRVFRALSQTASDAWKNVAETSFFSRFVEAGRIVETREADIPLELLHALSANWTMALEHSRVPFISYPYEWSFSMLRDAALLQLDLLLAALEEDIILKDSTPYNIQWNGSRPVFIDVASFEPWKEGDPWVGYLQFCQLFLYPLLLVAYRDLPFGPWLRGAIDGITPDQCNRVFSMRDRLRPGVFKDVYLQTLLQDRHADSDKSLRRDLQEAGFRREFIVNNIKRLRKIVSNLVWRRASSEWSDYAARNSYDEANREIKSRFVRDAAAHQHWEIAWDLGCNTGTFSRIIADAADLVVAIDADHLAVEHLYLSLLEEGPKNILPLNINLADVSPPLGWRHRERQGLLERTQPDLVLCLALIHHMVITANIPLPEFVNWLASLGAHVVIEFVTKDDPMVKKLLRNKPDIYHDYEVEVFKACFGSSFNVLAQETYHSGTRRIYFGSPRG